MAVDSNILRVFKISPQAYKLYASLHRPATSLDNSRNKYGGIYGETHIPTAFAVRMSAVMLHLKSEEFHWATHFCIFIFMLLKENLINIRCVS